MISELVAAFLGLVLGGALAYLTFITTWRYALVFNGKRIIFLCRYKADAEIIQKILGRIGTEATVAEVSKMQVAL